MRHYMFGAVIVFAALFQSPENVQQQFEQLRQQADAQRKSGDLHGRLQTALKIEKLLNEAPDAIEAAAQTYAEVGDTEHALAALSRYADLGQADDNMIAGTSKAFGNLQKLPEYKRLLQRFAENKTPVSHAEAVLTLDDPNILAEDIDYDSHSKSFLITSVLEKKIIRVTMDGRTTDFAQSPSHWPMLAIKIDANRDLVWATEVAMDGFSAAPKSDWGRSAIVCFDLRTGALRQKIEVPAKSALGDMVLTGQGDPIVSDGAGGGVYRVKGNQLERIDAGDFISPQTSAMHPDGIHVFVPDYARGIGILDLASKRVAWLDQSAPKFAINGIDGLYFDRGFLIATQNGTSPERVIRFKLDSTVTQIVSEEVIERATPTLGDPTHGVVVGDSFYYIANSGWNNLDDCGNVKAGSKLTPARIMRYQRPKA
jgi:sugar lactone lactonase YvrE